MSQSPNSETAKQAFDKDLRTALNGLYDPSVLRSSPLIEWLGVSQEGNPVAALRSLLIDGIEALQPQGKIPASSKSWRVYQILRRRYTEQLLQLKVAGDLGLSLRQIQREEKIAREMLREHLWKIYQLEGKITLPTNLLPETPVNAFRLPGGTVDLEWLRESTPVQNANLDQIVQDALSTLQRVLESAGVVVDYQPEGSSPQLYMQIALFRQGLLNLLNIAIARSFGGKILIRVSTSSGSVHLHIDSAVSSPASSVTGPEATESLHISRSFLELCDASLDVTGAAGPSAFHASITLPVTERLTVLVIEDNADTLQLYQRYLAESRYCLLAASSARQGLELAEQSPPGLIVLDVMMPESDGWELLGQLRVHPKTQNVPVIVCSIVPQPDLAFSLGAADFLGKPISRNDLLAALDRQVSRKVKGSG